MDLKKLLYFAAVAECGSFTKAAAQLRIAQPALSRQIGILEKEFGVELLLRMGRQVQLTDAGEVLLKHAHEINKSFERAREEMQSRGRSPKGRVILGAPPSLGSVIVPWLFERLRREAVDITLKVREGTTAFLERSIMDAEVDLALLGEDLSNKWIEDRVLAQEDIILVGHADLLKRVDTGELKSWNEIPLFVTWQVKLLAAFILRDSSIRLPDAFEFDAIHAIKTLAIDGRGIALTPIALFSSDIEAGRVSVARIRGADVSRPVVMASSAVRPRTRALEAVADILADEVENLNRRGMFSVPASAEALAVSLPSQTTSSAAR